MGQFIGHVHQIHIPELSPLANEFINRCGKDWNKYLWKLGEADRNAPSAENQKIVNEAIDILRPHLDKYNTPEEMVGEKIWKEVGTYTGIIVP